MSHSHKVCLAVFCLALLRTSVHAQPTPFLDPVSGGRTASDAALRPGDLILSRTNTLTSKLAGRATGGPVSHVMLYVGNGSVIEAIPGKGVRIVPVDTALIDDEAAVAVRKPDLEEQSATVLVDFATSQIGKEYDLFGAVSQARFRYNDKTWRINLGTDPDKFYCSNLVLEAFRAAGEALTLTDPEFDSPNDIVQLQWFGELSYVGHLKHGK